MQINSLLNPLDSTVANRPHTERRSVKFAWPLLRDILGHCQCVVSGVAIEIEPYIPPLGAFGSYAEASHRIFMSATVTDDAFLVKGLQLKPETIIHPLTYSKERWSGEKMVLLPSLIHEDLSRERIVKHYATPNSKRRHGVVALATAFARVNDWESYGALVANTDSVGEAIDRLRKGEYDKTIVLVNRYDWRKGSCLFTMASATAATWNGCQDFSLCRGNICGLRKSKSSAMGERGGRL